MLKQWLEPALEKRIDETVTIIDSNHLVNELNRQYRSVLSEILKTVPDGSRHLLYSLDTIKNDMVRISTEISYKTGFNDGIEILKCVDKLRI